MAIFKTLANFNGANGSRPGGALIIDAAGDLFGTTSLGGAAGEGTVFELAAIGGGYASAPTTLASFTGGAYTGPRSYLFADAAGDLFGTTSGIQMNGATSGNLGTVFELGRTASGFASTPITLVAFNNTDGNTPYGGLIADAAGNLFGTTNLGGTRSDGTVFEIARTAGGYASTATVLVSFNDTDGSAPSGSLLADAAGDLFGTTSLGGANGTGSVFELARTAGASPAHRPRWSASITCTGSCRMAL
jgi:uncharacterized repeat protein (TIGR03803 family)